MEDIGQLAYFCKYGHLMKAQELLQAKPDLLDISDDALHVACENGHVDIVQYLLDIWKETGKWEEIEEQKWVYFVSVCRNGHLQVVKFLIEFFNLNISINNDYALCVACENGHLEVVKYLFQINPSIKISGLTFATTCRNNGLEVVKYLLQNPESISSSKYYDSIMDFENALLYACGHGHLEVVKCLFQAKPHLNMNEAFRCACLFGHVNVAKWFASINPSKYVMVVKNGRIVSYIVM
jgi:ankyrin repeat protein